MAIEQTSHPNDTEDTQYEPAEEKHIYSIFDTIEQASHIDIVAAPTIDTVGAAGILSRACEEIDKDCDVHVPTNQSINSIVSETDSDSLVIGLGVTLPKVDNDSTVTTEEVEIIGEQPPESYAELDPEEIGRLVGTGQGITPVRLTPDGETTRLTPNTNPVSALNETAQSITDADNETETEAESDGETQNVTEDRDSDTESTTEQETTIETKTSNISQMSEDNTQSEPDEQELDENDTSVEENKDTDNDVPVFNPFGDEKETNDSNSNSSSDTTQNDTKQNTEPDNTKDNEDDTNNNTQSFSSDAEVVDISALAGDDSSTESETEEIEDDTDNSVDESTVSNTTLNKDKTDSTDDGNEVEDVEEKYGPFPKNLTTHPDTLSDSVLEDLVVEEVTDVEKEDGIPIAHPDWRTIPQRPTKTPPKTDSESTNDKQPMTDGGTVVQPISDDAGQTINATKGLDTFVQEVTQHIHASNVFKNPDSWLVTSLLHANPRFDNIDIQNNNTLPTGAVQKHYQTVVDNVTNHSGLGFVLDNVPSSLTWTTYVHGMFSNSARGLAQLSQQTTVSPPPDMDDDKWEDTVPNFGDYLLKKEYKRDSKTPHLKRFSQHNRIDNCSLSMASDVYTFEGVADVIETLALNQPETFINSITETETDNGSDGDGDDTDVIETWKTISEHVHESVNDATIVSSTDDTTVIKVTAQEKPLTQVSRLLHDVKSDTACTIVKSENTTVCVSYDDAYDAQEQLLKHDSELDTCGTSTIACSL